MDKRDWNFDRFVDRSARAPARDVAGGLAGFIALLFIVSFSTLSAPAGAETLRLSLVGQLSDQGLGANEDYDNASFSGFVEIDLASPQNDSSSNRFYNMRSWHLDLVPAAPNSNGAPIIRFASDGENDDRATITLPRVFDTIDILIQEDNAPSTRRALTARFDPGLNIVSSTRFEDFLTQDNQNFTTEPAFVNGSVQFAVSQFPTSALNVNLAVSLGTATRYVDGIDGDDQGGGNGCAVLANPCATIQQAVDSAQAGDTIEIADAVYTEILTVDKALSMRGESRSGTIIQAAADRGTASDRVISVADDTDFELSDATVRHGNTDLNGGGLECDGGDLLLERVTFTRNDADELGGGLSSGDNGVVMNDVIFRDNGNSDTRNGGGAFLGENFVVTDATFSNVIFENNTSGGVGGGLALFNGQAVLDEVVFAGNSSVDDNGGGLSYISSSGTLRNVAFVGNSALSFGGGMYTQFDAPYTMVNVLFSGNFANLGGGIYNQGGTDGDRILTNVTMSGNRAGLRGGAIDRPLDMTFRNTVIWNNRDESGTGTAEATMDDFFSDSVVEVSNSLLQGYPANAFPGSDNLDGADPGNNPLFRAAVNPAGAPSQAGNLRLRLESPVRDQGNNSFVAGIDTDIDGEARIFGGTVDLGPYEGTDVLFADGFEDSAL